MGKKPKVVLDKKSESKENRIRLLNLSDMEIKFCPLSKEGKRIKKLSVLSIGYMLIGLDDLTVIGVKIKGKKHVSNSDKQK